jgi:hypothetical protein
MAAAIRCPRCGYDLSGMVTAWEASCPLVCVCSECGLESLSVDVMRPERLVLPGFVEHASGVWQRVRWSVRTWVWALRPWVFWRKVELKYAPRWRGQVFWLLLLVAMPLVVIIASVLAVLSFNAGGQLDPNEALEVLLEAMSLSRARPWIAESGWSVVVAPLLAASLMWPVLLWTLGTTRATAKIRLGHVARAGVFGLAWAPLVLLVPLLDWLWPLAQALMDVLAGQSGGGLRGQTAVWGYGAGRLDTLLFDHWRVLLLLGLAWVEAWWAFAIGRGFRLERWWVVSAVLSVPVGLAAALAAILAGVHLLMVYW